MWSDVLKRAAWLDEERVTGYARIFACLYLVIAVTWIALSPNLIDPNGKPIGTDFMTVWSAGKLALAGEPAAGHCDRRWRTRSSRCCRTGLHGPMRLPASSA